MFNSSLFRNKDSSLTGGLTSGKIMDPRLAEGRGRPIWTVDDRESRVTPIDLQVRCALNAWNVGLITLIIMVMCIEKYIFMYVCVYTDNIMWCTFSGMLRARNL